MRWNGACTHTFGTSSIHALIQFINLSIYSSIHSSLHSFIHSVFHLTDLPAGVLDVLQPLAATAVDTPCECFCAVMASNQQSTLEAGLCLAPTQTYHTMCTQAKQALGLALKLGGNVLPDKLL